jgi:hypothetical protein
MFADYLFFLNRRRLFLKHFHPPASRTFSCTVTTVATNIAETNHHPLCPQVSPNLFTL